MVAYHAMPPAPLALVHRISAAEMLRGTIPITASGAKCNGGADDTASIQKLLSRAKPGTTVSIGSGRFCTILSANLRIPPGVTVSGSGRAIQTGAAPGAHAGSGFVLSPGYTITMGAGSSLRDLGIWRQGLVINPSPDEVRGAVKQWGREKSVAVTVPPNIGGVHLSGLFIEGFNTAVHTYSGQVYMNEIWGDDYNGIVVSGAGDNTYIQNSRFEPFYAFGVHPPNSAWNRPGVAFYAYANDTGLYFSDDFALCWQKGVMMDGVGVSSIKGLDVESCGSLGDVPGTIGIRYTNSNSASSVHDAYVSGYDTGIAVESGNVAIYNSIVQSAKVGVYLAGGYAKPAKFAIRGPVSPGQKFTAELVDTHSPSSEMSIAYSARPGDTRDSVASGLAKAINVDNDLAQAHISATSDKGILQVDWPANVHVSIKPAPAAVFARLGGSHLPINPGSGIVSGLEFVNISGPRFVVGNSAAPALAWTIANPYITNGTAALPPDWLRVPSIPNDSARMLTLTGIQWSHAFAGNLTSCGGSPGPAMSAGSTDANGTITEGQRASGCTLRFTTPFYRAPECTITSPTGTVLRGYRSSPGKLVLENVPGSGAEFTYHCEVN